MNVLDRPLRLVTPSFLRERRQRYLDWMAQDDANLGPQYLRYHPIAGDVDRPAGQTSPATNAERS